MPGRRRPEEDQSATEVERVSTQTVGVEVEYDHGDACPVHEDGVSQVADGQRRDDNRRSVLPQRATSGYKDNRKDVDDNRKKRQRQVQANHCTFIWHPDNVFEMKDLYYVNLGLEFFSWISLNLDFNISTILP